MKVLNNNIALVFAYLIVTILLVVNCHNSFFWDTVQLASKHANYYFSNHFKVLLLPTQIDSGHIPSFGIYIALIWKMFGRTLEASHLAILPFAIGIVWQMARLCGKFIPEQYRGLALILLIIDPSLLSQITLVSPDVPLVFFFLLAVNATLENRKLLLSLAILLLFLTSMRGMMLSICVLCLDLYTNIKFVHPIRPIFIKLYKRSLLYLPALFVFLFFNSYHYMETGWIGYHKDSPWAKCFEPAGSFKAVLFNFGLYGWRLLDYGKVIIWVVLFILIYKKQFRLKLKIKQMGFFTLCIMFILPLNLLWAKNLMGHRYLIPVYLTFALFTATVLFSDFVYPKLKTVLAVSWLLFLLLGNFWIYPTTISQGWDSTLAHLPYYQLRHDAISYLEHEQIPFDAVQSFFPNTASIDLIDLNHDSRHFSDFTGQSRYVFFCNIYNVEDENLAKIQDTRQYIPIKHFENRGVFITIYKKKQPTN